MANEYINRVSGESSRPELSPDGFRLYLNQLEEELDVKFIDIAKRLSPTGEGEIMLALGEFAERLRIMGRYLSPRIAPHNVSNLFSMVEVARGAPNLSKIPFDNLDIDLLRNQIVHTPDPIKRLMFNNKLIIPIGKRQLKTLDRTSMYYRLPQVDISVEMEGVEDVRYGAETDS